MASNDFLEWLQDQMNQRGWTRAELARRSGISPSQITRIMNREQGPGNDSIESIARAFHIPPETVYRAAGLLPPAQPIDDQRAELNYLFDNASDQKRDEMLRYARYLAQEAGKKPVPGH